MQLKERIIPLLLVDDDDDDYVLLHSAFKKTGVIDSFYLREIDGEKIHCINKLERVQDGDVLFEYLFSGNHVTPAIILLDFNMPKVDGREALQRLKSEVDFKDIPVIVFTNSISPDDVSLAYEYGAVSFIRKPRNFAGLLAFSQLFKQYWFELVEMP